jgi:TusA-related sulfurtransferase
MSEPATLDLKGEICPDPLIQVQDSMKKGNAGDRYVVILDYPLAVENVARWAEAEGHAVEVEQKGSEWEIRITMA